MRNSLMWVVLWFGVFGGLGCEKDRTPPLSEKCTKVAEQCKLPNGPLGVCNMAQCKPGETAPCLRCQPQH